jgi:hypothetical protein
MRSSKLVSDSILNTMMLEREIRMLNMDIWLASTRDINNAAVMYFHKIPCEILKQSGLWAYVYFADGTSETVYGWMIK